MGQWQTTNRSAEHRLRVGHLSRGLRYMTRTTRLASALAGLGLAAATVVAASPASAQLSGGGSSNAVRSESVRGARGFGGGNIHYPANASGALPVVAIAPGYTAPESSIRWIGPELAEEGVVAITIATNSTMDQPASRGRQLQAALDHVIANPPSGVQVDRTRLGVGGWSMGGGGAMTAAANNREIDAVLPLTPWHGTKNWRNLTTPTLVVAAQNDAVASVRQHAKPFYDSLGGEKVFIEFRGASHNLPTRSNEVLGNYMSAFVKLYLLDDASGASVLCQNDRAFSSYASTCPLIDPGTTPVDPGEGTDEGEATDPGEGTDEGEATDPGEDTGLGEDTDPGEGAGDDSSRQWTFGWGNWFSLFRR
jgi:dienelactone hydrolase